MGDLPSGTLAADEIFLLLAQPLADEDGFVRLDKFVGEIKKAKQGGTGVFPADLRSDQVVAWLSKEVKFHEHASATGVARVIGRQVEVLPDLIDNNMLAALERRLRPEELEWLPWLPKCDYFRLYWKARDVYRNGDFEADAIEQLREWARDRIICWRYDLQEVQGRIRNKIDSLRGDGSLQRGINFREVLRDLAEEEGLPVRVVAVAARALAHEPSYQKLFEGLYVTEALLWAAEKLLVEDQEH